MINLEKLLESENVEVSCSHVNVDKNFVKNFRKKNNLTQIALANILQVNKKTIEKWEQGVNNIKGCSAVLLDLLDKNPDLLEQLYTVKVNSGSKEKEDDGYKPVEEKGKIINFKARASIDLANDNIYSYNTAHEYEELFCAYC